jgi:3-oxoacyl-[acyl-carrier-protein] synthase-3
MTQQLQNCHIIGTGSYLPPHVVKNEEFDNIGSSDEWIQKRLGIKERHIADKGQPTSDLAVEAAKIAIEDAGVSVDDIDLIVLGTSSPDKRLPSTACIVQDKIHAYNAAAFDIAAACGGFIFGMNIASKYIATGDCKNVLVIGADEPSKFCDPESRDTVVFFGDGAGAAVLAPCEEGQGILASNIYSDGDGRHHLYIPAGGSEQEITQEALDAHEQYIRMDAKKTFEVATSVLPEAITDVLQRANLTVEDVDWVIPHQPGKQMLKTITDSVNIPWEKVMTNMDRYANTSAGTVPIMLDETYRMGKLKKGDIVVSVAIGAGWAWGATVYRWTKEQYKGAQTAA